MTSKKSLTAKKTIRFIATLMMTIALFLVVKVNLILSDFYSFIFNNSQDVYLDENGMVFGSMADGGGAKATPQNQTTCTSDSMKFPIVLPIPSLHPYTPHDGYVYSNRGTIRFIGTQKGRETMINMWSMPMTIYSRETARIFDKAKRDCLLK